MFDTVQIHTLKNQTNPSQPHISMKVIHTALYSFPMALTKRICLKMKQFLNLRSFPLVFSNVSSRDENIG